MPECSCTCADGSEKEMAADGTCRVSICNLCLPAND